MKKLKILVLDDEKGYRDELNEFLSGRDFDVYTAELPSLAFDILEKISVDIAIIDIRLPEMNGLAFLEELNKLSPDIEVIMITGHGDTDSVIKALRLGASDFFRKPFKLSEVYETIKRSEKFLKYKLKEKNSGIVGKQPVNQFRVGDINIIADSDSMKAVLDATKKVAASKNTTVLITGESGTGKELIARLIHYLSPRKEHNFLPVNCSAIPNDLFESEFFGYKKGSFTGATSDNKGWFASANKGTLFLDEISEMKYELQSKFLRVIEDKKISRIGSRQEVDVDVRIVAATNQNLEKLVEEKKFRKDLFFRLNSFVIHLPSLHLRKEDIPPLFNYFVDKISKQAGKKIVYIERFLCEKMMNYSFPGNIRELKNMVERAIIMADGEKLTSADFPELKILSKNTGSAGGHRQPEKFDLKGLEKNYIVMDLERNNKKKTKAAELLNRSCQALDRKLRTYGIEKREKIRYT
ncbi:MAG: sigma-54 dependent transcriptional regulator, partial [Bacteroidales bacterium]|nr:sigma-54 dependent transcriptional regulator [Bacteroidales bacterium]